MEIFTNDYYSSSSTELFFSESEDSIDVVLNEQDVIIDGLRKENEQLKKDMINLKNKIKDHLVECMKQFTEVYDKIKYDVF
jgi:hypothetical protein